MGRPAFVDELAVFGGRLRFRLLVQHRHFEARRDGDADAAADDRRVEVLALERQLLGEEVVEVAAGAGEEEAAIHRQEAARPAEHEVGRGGRRDDGRGRRLGQRAGDAGAERRQRDDDCAQEQDRPPVVHVAPPDRHGNSLVPS